MGQGWKESTNGHAEPLMGAKGRLKQCAGCNGPRSPRSMDEQEAELDGASRRALVGCAELVPTCLQAT